MTDQQKPGVKEMKHLGFINLGNIFWNLSPAELIKLAILNNEGDLTDSGALSVSTGFHTGRSPKDKFIVSNTPPEDLPIWWGDLNKPIEEEKFNQIFMKFRSYFQNRNIYVQDLYIGAHPDYKMPIRIITENAWHSLFSRNLLIVPSEKEYANFNPEFTLIQAEGFKVNPEEDGTFSETFIGLDFSQKIVLIAASGYAGEIKKSMFSIFNYLLPHKNVLPMHCSANVGKEKDVALFFGLSGTGKTTLSSARDRFLIGDDEHGWSEAGVFNFEGGCYAKTINLDKKFEPIIWDAANHFSSVLENVVIDKVTKIPDFTDNSITENTRAAYPLEFVPNHIQEGYAGHPKNIFFLSADAFGVLPPISKLDPDQAMYYFLSGYTAKLAGTEVGLGKEPEATFSTCFGSPFLPLHPSLYAKMLKEKIEKHSVNVWLVNTGWSGGPYGIGSRINLPITRALIRAALSDQIQEDNLMVEPTFGLKIPTNCKDVPDEILNPINTWKDKASYTQIANELKKKFEDNYETFSRKLEKV